MMVRFSYFGIVLVFLLTVSSQSLISQNVTLRLTTPNDQYRTWVAWTIVNESTGTSVHCQRTYSTHTTNVTFNAPVGDYVIYAWYVLSGAWRGAALTVTRVEDGAVLVSGARRTSGSGGTHSCGSLTSNSQVIARFTVRPACDAPTITAQPTSRTVCPGTQTTLSVSSSMTNGTYEWRKDGQTLETTTSNSYTFDVGPSSGGSYDVVLRDNCNPNVAVRTSAVASVTVAVPPAITTDLQPVRSVCEGADDTLRIRAVGTGRTFQWRRNGEDIEGANDSSLVIINAGSAHLGTYECVVSGLCEPTVATRPMTYNVIFRPRATLEPDDAVFCPGTNGTLTYEAQGTNIRYQWYRNGQAIPSGFGSQLSLNQYAYSMNGLYYCEATSEVPNPNNCQVTIRSREVQVSGYPTPTLNLSPESGDVCVGGIIELVSEFTGSGLNYELFKDGVAIPNINSNVLTIRGANAGHSGTFTVRATATCSLYAESSPATISVITRPTITKDIRSRTVEVGKELVLSFEGTDIREVQWTKNGEPIDGATDDTLRIPQSQYSDAGSYLAIVRNSCGATTTSPALVRVIDEVIPTPEIELAQTSINVGEIPLGYASETVAENLIRNVGTASLEIASLMITSAGFEIADAPAVPFSLEPGESASITVRAVATAVGSMSGSIDIVSTDPLTPALSVKLTAESVLRYSTPQLLDFGTVVTGEQKTLCIDVVNTSSVDIDITNASIVGTDESMFRLLTATPVNIAAGQTAELCLEFAPGESGSRVASLRVVSENGGNSDVEISGTGESAVSVIDFAESAVLVSPNPASDIVRISFATSIPTATVDVYSSTGELAMSLTAEDITPQTAIEWDCRDSNGMLVPNGMYVVLVRSGDSSVTTMISIVR